MIAWVAWLREITPVAPSVLVSVLASEGSAPRGAGTRMLVTAEGIHGTIGGGQLEYRAVEQARAVLRLPPGEWRIQDYPLGPLLGQCCGGRVRLLIERVDPARLEWTAAADAACIVVTTLTENAIERRIGTEATPPLSARGDKPQPGTSFSEVIGGYRRPLYLFGAGHVGQAIARHAEHLPFHLAWFDTRPDFAAVPRAAIVEEAGLEQCVEDAPEDAAVVIVTHDHALDYRLTRAALRRETLGRGTLAFVGLIGSATKRARFESRLATDGIDEPTRARLTSPIGVAGVSGKEPDVIAIATLAQLLQLGSAGSQA